MTAIVGLVHDNRVYIGADSAGICGWSLVTRADRKVVRNGPYVVAGTGSPRMRQVVEHATLPDVPAGDLYRFMCTTFVDTLRQALKAGGHASKTNDQETVESVLLVGVAGHLFRVDGDYQIVVSSAGFDAVGCGDELALGAMHAIEGQPPKVRIRTALEAAERFSAGGYDPFTILSVGTARGRVA